MALPSREERDRMREADRLGRARAMLAERKRHESWAKRSHDDFGHTNGGTIHAIRLQNLLNLALAAGASGDPKDLEALYEDAEFYMDDLTPFDYGSVVRIKGNTKRGGGGWFDKNIKGVLWSVSGYRMGSGSPYRQWKVDLIPLTRDFGGQFNKDRPYDVPGGNVELVIFNRDQERELRRAADESPEAATKLWMSWQPLIDRLADLAE